MRGTGSGTRKEKACTNSAHDSGYGIRMISGNSDLKFPKPGAQNKSDLS